MDISIISETKYQGHTLNESTATAPAVVAVGPAILLGVVLQITVRITVQPESKQKMTRDVSL